MRKTPTYLGSVGDVKGSTISVELDAESPSGLVFVNGNGYRIGQLGSFVRIPIGLSDLFGIVSQVGASAIPEKLVETQGESRRWLSVQVIGEGAREGNFQRGLTQHPTVGDEVHIVTIDDLKRIYGRPESPEHISVGTLASAQSIPALININKLITRHSAVVGATGSGKSTTVTGLLEQLSMPDKFGSARIILVDIHGEYAQALKDRANIFRINPNKQRNEKPLFIPYWAMKFEELVEVSFGGFPNDIARGGVLEEIRLKKISSLEKQPRDGVNSESLTVDTPVPFSLHKLWYDLFLRVGATHTQSGSQSESSVAFELDDKGIPIDKGDPMKVRPPRCRPQTQEKGKEKVYLSQSPLNIRSQLEALSYRLRDSRYDFLFNPGKWLPDIEGVPDADLDELLSDWLHCEKPITILDLSGVPNEILTTLIGVLLRIIYDALFWSRNLPEGGRERPLLVVLEEAHTYLNDEAKNSLSMVKRIVKEGRKYGISAMIVSQRPSEIDPTVLSQCGTFISLRLNNTKDRTQITSAASDDLEGLFNMLPILKTGEAILVGEGVHIPTRAIIATPQRRPDSLDPVVFEAEDKPGGWNKKIGPSDYGEVVALWRRQDPSSSKVKVFEQ